MSTDRRINPIAKDHFYRTVGDALCAARVQQGLSAYALAAKAGLTLNTVQKAEDGSSCSLMVWAILGETLDVNINDLLPLDALR